MAMVAGKLPPTNTPRLTQRRNGALSPITECSTGHWLDPSAKAKFHLMLQAHGSSEIELVEKMVDETLNRYT